MPLIFPEELVVGVPEVDDQHRSFYRQLNDLHAAMREHDLAAVHRLVEFLERYVRDHFAMEERLMIEAGYPGFPAHLERHGEFTKDLKRWRARLTERGPTASLVVELSSWITGWLADHIRKVDGEMARFLRRKTAER